MILAALFLNSLQRFLLGATKELTATILYEKNYNTSKKLLHSWYLCVMLSAITLMDCGSAQSSMRLASNTAGVPSAIVLIWS